LLDYYRPHRSKRRGIDPLERVLNFMHAGFAAKSCTALNGRGILNPAADRGSTLPKAASPVFVQLYASFFNTG
jgi:hypothetical protein